MNDKNLGESLSELIVEQGITVEKLSELTNIPKRYLSAMAENDRKNMPAAPYVKGYIAKICTTLSIDPEPLLESYKRTDSKTSGKDDFLPKNRFALTKRKRGWLVVVPALIVIIAIFFIGKYLFANFIGIPPIDINLPEKVGDMEFLETREKLFTIQGKINPKDSIIIHNEPVSVSADGSFSKEVILDAGLNTFEIKVKRFLGKEITVIRKVLYITENLNEEINNIDNGEETIQEENL